MNELEKARAEIDRIDREMARLFEQRMAAAGRAAAYKRKKGLPVLDSAREKAVLDSGMARLRNKELAGYYASFLSNLLFLSRRFQARQLGRATVACREDEPAEAKQLAAALLPGAELLPTATVRDVFEAVEGEDAALGLVPFGDAALNTALALAYSHRCVVAALVQAPGQEGPPARYAVLANRLPAGGDRLALLVDVENQVGRLAEVMETLAAEGFHLETVRSCPVPEKPTEHFYYIQLLCPAGLRHTQALLAWVEGRCRWCRVLGVFSQAGGQAGAQAPGQLELEAFALGAE